MPSSVFADVVTSPPFWSHFGAPRAHFMFHGKIFSKLNPQTEKGLGSTWKEHLYLRRKINFSNGCLQMQNTPIIKAIATLECKHLVGREDGSTHDSNLQLNSVSDYQVQQTTEDTLEMNERERIRRLRISKANKGNVPWNKGRKHSAETLQKIRERTRMAMQDPKVKLKLLNTGHAQSEETRMKIGAGVREGWQRRHEMLLVQDSCCLEWQNIIAEKSRKGYGSDEELHWDSYKTLDEQLEKEWLESIERRKTIPRSQGKKITPKSLEQRRKISEAILAKWADPGYRDRVCSGLAKYHGIPVGAERKRRRKPVGDGQTAERKTVKKKTAEPKHEEKDVKLIKNVQRKRKTVAPSYKDPMASSKLEMIRKIREQRATTEARKWETTERAKLLIAEAEKAANVLEVVALRSPLARASLLETRKLIAEAAHSIERIESGQLALQENGENTYLNGGKPINHFQSGPEACVGDTSVDGQQGNRRAIHFLNQRSDVNFDIRNFSKQNSLNGKEPLCEVNGTKNTTECVHDTDLCSCVSDSAGQDLDIKGSESFTPNGSFEYNGISPRPEGKEPSQARTSDRSVSSLTPDGSSNCTDLSSISEDKGPLQAGTSIGSITSLTKTKKRWICGRLVDLEDD